MRRLTKIKNSRSKKRLSGLRHDYGTLEDRRVLATLTSLDALTGQLTVELTSQNDVASINIQAGLVTVNGNNDLDSGTEGTQSLNYQDLRSIVINGDATMSGQKVELRGNFSVAASADLQSVSISDVNSVVIIGNYVLATDFSAILDGDTGGVNDGQFGRLRVLGTTNIDAGNNPIVLNNELNDFVGSVSLRTGDVGNSVWIHDANDIEFASLLISNDIRVTAGGNITDTDDSIIQVADWGSFFGANVEFGNNTTGTTEFFQLTVNATGHAELYLDSMVMFSGLNNMGSLEVDTDHGIHDGRKTAINVAGLAVFRGAEAIRLGDLDGDIFNAGSLNFTSNGMVEISENSSMQIVGDNTANTMNLHSFGNITDADDAIINVAFVARFSANNVYIGDTSADQFNAGSIQFNSVGDMFLNEDSGTHLVESSTANRFELKSNGAISDADDASIVVTTLSKFVGDSVMIGETTTDVFRSGWITFEAVNRVFIFENDATNIANLNTANMATIVSMGAVTNAQLARIFVTENASFSGTQIAIGNKTGDNLKFGGLQVNAINSATVFEDDGTNFIGASTATELRMNSVGSITDAVNSRINVSGASIFHSETAGIKLGDSTTDEFNAGSLTVDALNGVVNITENSDIFLVGVNQAKSLVLNAQGTITDSDLATIDLNFLLSVTGTEVNLGDAATDVLRFGSLTFNTSGNTSISSQQTMILTGSSAANGQLALTSEGNIFDSADAQTAADSAILTAINIVLGDTDMDCFDVLEANTVVAASGVSNIIFGC